MRLKLLFKITGRKIKECMHPIHHVYATLIMKDCKNFEKPLLLIFKERKYFRNYLLFFKYQISLKQIHYILILKRKYLKSNIKKIKRIYNFTYKNYTLLNCNKTLCRF